MKTPSFSVISGANIARMLADGHADVMDIVRKTYLLHGASLTNNPDSYFLRFPDKPAARLIALPAAIRGDDPLSGIKWIASYPDNIRSNLQRASATLILNDYETGYPFACLEASRISAARTAASAVLAAEVLSPRPRAAGKIGFVGAGIISKTTLDYFHANGWSIEEVAVHDIDDNSSAAFANHASKLLHRPAHVCGSLDELVAQATHVVFATTADKPYVHDTQLFKPGQLVLNLSLRDLSPAIILAANNVFDDVEHCMKANTSPHLAEQQTGGRDFVSGTISDALLGRLVLDGTRPTVLSPFGLGILDLALGKYLFDRAIQQGSAVVVEGFFDNISRW